jgi:N-acetylglutamate synthase-like GNAT family acetyltransferase
MSGSDEMKEQSTRSIPRRSARVRIVDLRLGDDSTAFRNLNEEWIAKYFTLEDRDREILGNPDEHVLRRGGRIFMLYSDERAVGCAALVPMRDDVYELSKMSVAPDQRGFGLGRKLIEHTIVEARLMGAKALFLGTNTKLQNAVSLYESVGFKHVPPERIPRLNYLRANVFMDLKLQTDPLANTVEFDLCKSRTAESAANRKAPPPIANGLFLGLMASGPAAEIPASQNIYGRFVGSWVLDVLFYRKDLRGSGIKGEAHFGWVLEGRAIQDVWILPSRNSAKERIAKGLNMYGTTLRIWDAGLGRWRVTWMNPITGACDRLQAGCSDGDIVQTGHHEDGTPIRWVFSDITDDSFHWTGDALEANGMTWKREAEFLATRNKP